MDVVCSFKACSMWYRNSCIEERAHKAFAPHDKIVNFRSAWDKICIVQNEMVNEHRNGLLDRGDAREICKNLDRRDVIGKSNLLLMMRPPRCRCRWPLPFI